MKSCNVDSVTRPPAVWLTRFVERFCEDPPLSTLVGCELQKSPGVITINVLMLINRKSSMYYMAMVKKISKQ